MATYAAGMILKAVRSGTKCKPKRLIIQITTIGNSTVHKILAKLEVERRKFSMPNEIWVVTEPYDKEAERYKADRIIMVSNTFETLAHYKARALEYARILRQKLGYDDSTTKIIFLDDDTWVDAAYIEEAYYADADICQGYCNTNNVKGFMALVDCIRVQTCKFTCRCFQYFYPIWVHGEGLCIRANVEQKVSWSRFPLSASEDLVFGHWARILGFRWMYIDSQVHATAPLSFKAYVKQRRRWVNGNISAMLSFLPSQSSLLILSSYATNQLLTYTSMIGLGLWLMGMIILPSPLWELVLLNFSFWWGMWFYSGYKVGGLRYAFPAMVLAHLITALHTVVLSYSILSYLFRGPVKKFEVIEKAV